MKEEYKPERVTWTAIESVGASLARENTATRLELASQLLVSVIETLNDTTEVCDGCGKDTRENFDEWQAVEALRAAQTRIMKAAQSVAASKLKAHYGVKTFTELREL